MFRAPKCNAAFARADMQAGEFNRGLKLMGLWQWGILFVVESHRGSCAQIRGNAAKFALSLIIPLADLPQESTV